MTVTRSMIRRLERLERLAAERREQEEEQQKQQQQPASAASQEPKPKTGPALLRYLTEEELEKLDAVLRAPYPPDEDDGDGDDDAEVVH